MIDLIHLERLRQQRLRYETAQRLTVQAGDSPPRPQPNGRRSFLRVVSAVVVGWAIDGTAMRSRAPRARS